MKGKKQEKKSREKMKAKKKKIEKGNSDVHKGKKGQS